jgi:uncharacterized membrane protein YphA (DoxX/SURF4 family)
VNLLTYFLAAIGRICISLIFIIIGCASIYNWQVAEVDLVNVFTAWQGHVGSEDLSGIFGTFVSTAPLFMAVAIALQLIGGIFLFLGYQVRFGAFFLLLYLLPTTILYHHFWFLTGHQQSLELILFLKNIAIIGGVIVVLALGKGARKSPSFSNTND